jgi:hypothetical protein
MAFPPIEMGGTGHIPALFHLGVVGAVVASEVQRLAQPSGPERPGRVVFTVATAGRNGDERNDEDESRSPHTSRGRRDESRSPHTAVSAPSWRFPSR